MFSSNYEGIRRLSPGRKEGGRKARKEGRQGRREGDGRMREGEGEVGKNVGVEEEEGVRVRGG